MLAGLASAALETGFPPDSRDAETRVNAAHSLAQAALALYSLPPSTSSAGGCGSGSVSGSGTLGMEAADGAAAGAAGAIAAAAGAAAAAEESGVAAEGESWGGGRLADEAVRDVCASCVEPLLLALEDYSTDNR